MNPTSFPELFKNHLKPRKTQFLGVKMFRKMRTIRLIMFFMFLGSQDPRTLGPQDPRTLGPQDTRILGPQDPRTLGPQDQDPRILGPQDPRILGPQDPRILGPQDPRTLGSQDPRILGPQILGPQEILRFPTNLQEFLRDPRSCVGIPTEIL